MESRSICKDLSIQISCLAAGYQYEAPMNSRKLTYAVNSATVQLKGKVAENQNNKSVSNAVSKSASSNNVLKTNLELNNQNKGFGNLKIENMPQQRNASVMVNNHNKANDAPVNNGQMNNVMLQFQQSMQQMANSFMETQQRGHVGLSC